MKPHLTAGRLKEILKDFMEQELITDDTPLVFESQWDDDFYAATVCEVVDVFYVPATEIMPGFFMTSETTEFGQKMPGTRPVRAVVFK